MKTKIYVIHSDGGHAWLAVKRRELEFLNIIDQVTAFSYEHGKTVYLEEDCDVGLFFEAYRKAFGTLPQTRESYRNVSPVRGYNRFKKNVKVVDELELVDELFFGIPEKNKEKNNGT